MARITGFRTAYFVFLLTGFLSGILVGTTTVTAMISYKLDVYLQQIKHLESTEKEKDARLAKLEKAINNKKFIVKNVEVFFQQFQGDEIEKTELANYIKERYYTILGKEVKNVDISLTLELIHNRFVHINNNVYQISITQLVLTDVLKVWVQVKKIEMN